MEKLKVCFVGVGSIAKRHIRNLVRICREDSIDLIIDAVRRSGLKGYDEEFGHISRIYSKVEDLKDEYDAIFITNPTAMHISTLEKVAPHGKNFFIEKPVSSLSDLDAAEQVVRKANAIYYVACPLRYHPVIQYIRDNIRTSDVLSVRCISSSYLPEWRKGQDYRGTYSARKVLGGGVSIDLIHEWDYLTYIFGTPLKVNYMGGRKSELEIDSDDYAIYIGEYSDMIVEIHLDYFGRKTIREMMLFTKDDTIVGDIINNRITFLTTGEVIDFSEERDEYRRRELRHFLNMIDGVCGSDSSINHAVKVLRLTQGVVQ